MTGRQHPIYRNTVDQIKKDIVVSAKSITASKGIPWFD